MLDSPSLPRRSVGHQGPLVGALGLGCMGLTGVYGRLDHGDALAVVRAAVDAGVTLFDTADVYSQGLNESLVGEALGRDVVRRHDLVVATKFGIVRAADGALLGFDGSPDYARHSCDASLRRLGLDSIGLYYLHRVDPAVPIEETVGAMAELVIAGKVRHLGVCEVTAEQLRRACSVHRIAAVQSEWSLWTRDIEAEVAVACGELGVGIVPFCPLGRGFLTDTDLDPLAWSPGDMRRFSPRFDEPNLDQNRRIASGLRALARERGCSAAALALAWLLSRSPMVVPIPGTGSRAHLHENLGATDLELGPTELAALEAIAPPGVAAGARTRDLEAASRAVNLAAD